MSRPTIPQTNQTTSETLGELRAALAALREQAAAERAARETVEAEGQYGRELFAWAPDAYVITDAAGRIRLANRAAEALLNVAPGRLSGKGLASFFEGGSRGGLRQRLQKLKEAGEPLAWEDQVKPRRQPRVEVAISVSPHGEPVELRWRLHNLAERRQWEQALRDSEERYLRLVHTTLEAIYLYDAFSRKLLEANPAFQQLLGYSAAEVPGLTVYDIAGHERADVDRWWHKIMAGGPVDLGERRWRRKDGRLLDVQVTASLIRQGERDIVCIVGRDISAHKAAEARLRESEARFRRLTENAPDIIYRFRLGPDPAYEYLSPAVTSLLGFTPDEFYADPHLGVNQTHPDDRDALRAVVDHPERTGQLITVRRIHKDGHIIWTEQRPVVLVDENGRPVAVEGVIRDISAQKQSEADQARAAVLIQALSEVAARLQDKLEPDRIIATMSEELARFEINCLVLLADGDGHMVVRHVSLDPARVAFATMALGAPLRGFRFATERMPMRDELLVRHQALYIDAFLPLAVGVLGNRSEAELAAAVQQYGLRPDVRGVCAPLVAENQTRGLLLLWGLDLQASDVAAVTIFASQVTSALENARLFEAERDQRSLAEALRRTAELLNSTLEFEQVLDQILVQAEGLVGYDLALITLVDPEENLNTVRSRAHPPFERSTPPGTTRYHLHDFQLLSETVTSRQPLVIPDTTAHPDWVVVPESAWTRSHLVAPLRMKGQVTGFISLSSHRVNFYGAAHAPRLQALADQAAVALENALLFEQLRSGQQQLQALSQRLLEVQESERRLIARELHDEVGQALTGLKLFLEANSRAAGETADTRLTMAQTLVDDLINRVRDLSLDLRPTMLDDLGLVPALLWQFERYTAQTGIHVNFQHFGLVRRFDPDVETAAYRIVQEALTNVARYAQVSEATVNLWADSAMLNVQIEDQGVGFDVNQTRTQHNSNGLAGMRERATLLEGQLTVETAPGAGTQITAELPLLHAPREAVTTRTL